MHHFETRRIVKYSSEQMFDLVADIESYPEFLPLCKALIIQSREQHDDKLLLVAKTTVGYIGIHETLTSQVLLQRSSKTINIEYIDGPFYSLNNYWRFENIDGTICEVHFSIAYEFKNLLFNVMLRTMFDHAFPAFVEAFERLAKIIYGSLIA